MSSTMASPGIMHTRLGSGLELAVEPMPGVQSAAVQVLLPGGLAAEAEGAQGSAGLLAEMLLRGSGGKSAREVSDALDGLGAERSTSATTHHVAVAASCVADRLMDLLPMVLEIARRPNLEAEAFTGAKALAVQAIEGLADEPQRRAILELKRRHLPGVLGRSDLGELEDVRGMTVEAMGELHARIAVPGGAIVGVAGNVDAEAVAARVGELTEGWSGAAEAVAGSDDRPTGYTHLEAKTTQVHIAGASHAVAERDAERAVVQQAAVAALSGGMSGRLFTEVREKRGLCYSVFATYSGLADRGAVFSYAGTTTARAQETLDVLAGELDRLSEGITQEEFDRAIVGMKSRLVMQGESTAARAAAISRDVYVHGGPRTLGARAAQVDALTLDAVNAFVAEGGAKATTWVTIGPEALVPPAG